MSYGPFQPVVGLVIGCAGLVVGLVLGCVAIVEKNVYIAMLAGIFFERGRATLREAR